MRMTCGGPTKDGSKDGVVTNKNTHVSVELQTLRPLMLMLCTKAQAV